VTDWTDRVLDLQVGPVAHGGHCVARQDGRVVFVRHALPGERVHAIVTEDGGGAFCRADTVAVLDAAPQRVEPVCAWARAGGCGGCDLQHVTPEAQRALKAAVLAEQLQRLAGIDRPVEVEELPGGALGCARTAATTCCPSPTARSPPAARWGRCWSGTSRRVRRSR
jgi:tRNA/tmRNA/rRNA uracil-C5-methylase (TrmA/RlmC/RlmD family)